MDFSGVKCNICGKEAPSAIEQGWRRVLGVAIGSPKLALYGVLPQSPSAPQPPGVVAPVRQAPAIVPGLKAAAIDICDGHPELMPVLNAILNLQKTGKYTPPATAAAAVPATESAAAAKPAAEVKPNETK